ncbi:ribonuclease H-like domain-containing protein, partial [Tanacetum coccineum]
NPNPNSVHPTNRPPKRLNIHVSSISPLPKSYTDAFNDKNWQNAMCDEYNALIKNKTLTLVPGPICANIVRCTIQTVLILATSRHWPVHQLDVKNAFLHGDLSETVYMHLHPGFRDSTHTNYQTGLSGLGTDTAYLLVYVNDIVLTASFEIFRTLVDTESKLGDDGDPVSDPTLYRSFTGALQYLTFTRPDISYAVQQVSLYMYDPRELHFSALKRILRYVRGTLDNGL